MIAVSTLDALQAADLSVCKPAHYLTYGGRTYTLRPSVDNSILHQTKSIVDTVPLINVGLDGECVQYRVADMTLVHFVQ